MDSGIAGRKLKPRDRGGADRRKRRIKRNMAAGGFKAFPGSYGVQNRRFVDLPVVGLPSGAGHRTALAAPPGRRQDDDKKTTESDAMARRGASGSDPNGEG